MFVEGTGVKRKTEGKEEREGERKLASTYQCDLYSEWKRRGK